MISLAFIVSKEKEKNIMGDRKEELEGKEEEEEIKNITSPGSSIDLANRVGVQVLRGATFTVIVLSL